MKRRPMRQGDVLLIPCSAFDSEALYPVERDSKSRVVLALGEVTGHAHAIVDEAAELFRTADLDEMADRFLRVTEQVALVHEEHATITVPRGNYVVRHKREYSPERIRVVYD